jgi:hypothetical protein
MAESPRLLQPSDNSEFQQQGQFLNRIWWSNEHFDNNPIGGLLHDPNQQFLPPKIPPVSEHLVPR